MQIDLFWGVKELNTEGGSHWDAEFIGKAVMDDKFDLTPVAAQTSILNFCKDLRKQTFVKNGKVICWLEAFNAWVIRTTRTRNGRYQQLPLQPAEFQAKLLAFRATPLG